MRLRRLCGITRVGREGVALFFVNNGQCKLYLLDDKLKFFEITQAHERHAFICRVFSPESWLRDFEEYEHCCQVGRINYPVTCGYFRPDVIVAETFYSLHLFNKQSFLLASNSEYSSDMSKQSAR